MSEEKNEDRSKAAKNVKVNNYQADPPKMELPSTFVPASQRQSRTRRWLIIGGGLGILALIGLLIYGQTLFFSSPKPIVKEEPALVLSPTFTPTVTPLATATISQSRNFTFVEPTAIPTSASGGQILILKPVGEGSGWVVSTETLDDPSPDSPNHFGDSFLYAGILDGKIYHGALQFDLGYIPRGTKIHGANLRLQSLRTDLLGDGEGVWQFHFLAPEINYNWQSVDYGQLHNAATINLLGSLTKNELGEGKINEFEFTPEQLRLLEEQISKSSDEYRAVISLRIDGPMEGEDNLYAWDSGYGLASRGVAPELFLNLGPAPSATVPPDYVLITSTPTPENIMTAAAVSLQMTAEANQVGTATPLPPHWVTPIPVTATPIPANTATAELMDEIATAVALTTGVPAAKNFIVVTSTPVRPEIPPTPIPILDYVIVTSTPTPENIMTAAAISLQMTAEANRVGTATPLPTNWVTPLVVTSTPTPGNNATVEYLQAVALTTGTPTPLPGNAQTATPTPVFEVIDPLLAPTATATPTATPDLLPAVLLGRIAFLSDRERGTTDEPKAYVYDPQTGELGRLTSLWPYEVAAAREPWSADGQFRVFTKDAIRHSLAEGEPSELVPALYVFDYLYQVEWQLTKFGAGIAYGGVWSPTSNQIVFVSNESADDEIWVVNHDGTNLQRLTSTNEAYNAREIGKDTFIPEINKQPSWSPNGEQIVFYSNRTGTSQLWIMNKDGSDQRLLMEPNPYNDYDPIWIKTLDPAPPLIK